MNKIKNKINNFCKDNLSACFLMCGIAFGSAGVLLGCKYSDYAFANALEKACLIHPEINDLMIDSFKTIDEGRKFSF